MMCDVALILDRVQQGDPKAADELLPLVHEELRKLAAHRMANEAPDQTLQSSALVHEPYLRLADDKERKWNDSSNQFPRRKFVSIVPFSWYRSGGSTTGIPGRNIEP